MRNNRTPFGDSILYIFDWYSLIESSMILIVMMILFLRLVLMLGCILFSLLIWSLETVTFCWLGTTSPPTKGWSRKPMRVRILRHAPNSSFQAPPLTRFSHDHLEFLVLLGSKKDKRGVFRFDWGSWWPWRQPSFLNGPSFFHVLKRPQDVARRGLVIGILPKWHSKFKQLQITIDYPDVSFVSIQCHKPAWNDDITCYWLSRVEGHIAAMPIYESLGVQRTSQKMRYLEEVPSNSREPMGKLVVDGSWVVGCQPGYDRKVKVELDV